MYFEIFILKNVTNNTDQGSYLDIRQSLLDTVKTFLNMYILFPCFKLEVLRQFTFKVISSVWSSHTGLLLLCTFYIVINLCIFVPFLLHIYFTR